MSAVSPSGGLVVDKPRGITSHDVVARARRALRTRAVGHAGTLDPMATGVLVLGVGEGTKLCAVLTGDDKTYEARVAFGASTASDDADGEITARGAPPARLLEELARLESLPSPLPSGGLYEVAALLSAALTAELARTEQVPPRVSALHVDGERAHVRARRGEELALPVRPVRLKELSVLGASSVPPTLTLQVTVEKGYYVRALARDLGIALGVPAHLVELRRSRSGAFVLEDAVSLDRLVEGLVPLVPFASRALGVLRLEAEETTRVRHGQKLRLYASGDSTGGAGRGPPPPSPFLAVSPDGEAVALAELRDGVLVVVRGFS